MLLEWWVDQKPEGTSRLQYRAVARVLREQRPLTLATGPDTDPRAA